MLIYSKYFYISILFVVLITFGKNTTAQTTIENYFKRIELRIDTNVYTFQDNKIIDKGQYKLSFEHKEMNPVVVFHLYPAESNIVDRTFQLANSEDYVVLDSMRLLIDGYYHCKIKFTDLSESEFLNIFLTTNNNKTLALPLFPYTHTYATIYPGDTDLYIGEIKKFPLVTNNDGNISLAPKWEKEENYEYRIYREEENIMVAILPTKAGEISFELPISLNRPNMEDGESQYYLETQTFNFTVKGSRLTFLNFDQREVVWKPEESEGVELQIDQHPNLEINKTYRIEATDEKGGPLIAELFTVRRLSNERVLCMFRPYNYHKIAKGYLFVKDGDTPKFITNINIVKEPKINNISILRKGGTWVDSRTVYPGEKVEIRLEGEGLSRANFKFEDVQDISTDSVVQTELVSHFILKIPVDIHKKSINIYNGNKKTGMTLNVQEFQRPRQLDFVVVEYGGSPVIASEVQEPILHRGTIGDVTLHFDDNYIDERNELYGKQYLEVEVRIKDNNNKLLEKQIIDDIEICPGSDSPRSFSYTSTDGCLNEAVSINDYLSNKTHSLENWSTVEVVIRHRKNFYNGQGHSARIEIIKEKLVTFDVDLSIPAGLIIKTVGEEGFPGLSGISLSMLAQFSFYQKGEIQRLRPYKIGAGFLAKNAFNFNPEADRDLGIVILGSVYPTRKNRKFSFPLYAGMGYFLNQEKFFYLIGPGIRINF